MKFLLGSDFHGQLPSLDGLGKYDFFLYAGDVSPLSYEKDLDRVERWLYRDFNEWLGKVPARHKIGIAGNHDFVFDKIHSIAYDLDWIYLEDEAIEIEGLKFFGMPWVKLSKAWAFSMQTDIGLALKVSQIPKDTNILLSHSPAYGFGDRVKYMKSADPSVGSAHLASRILHELKDLNFMVTGHIHEGFGQYRLRDVPLINASFLDEVYSATNHLVEIEI